MKAAIATWLRSVLLPGSIIVRRLIPATVSILLILLPAGQTRAEPATIRALHGELATMFSTLGLGYREGLELIQHGLSSGAIQYSLTQAGQHLAQDIHVHGARELVRQGLERNVRFLTTVVARLRWLIATGALRLANARELVRGSHWVGRAGAVSLEPFLSLVAVLVVMEVSFNVGEQATKAYLREMDQVANEAEEKAYADLVRLLVERTTKGNVKLCDGMTYGEAATRLRINMHTSPGQPFWRIICTGQEGSGNFAISGVNVPNVVSNGPRGDLTFSYTGTVAFPLTAVFRPARRPCMQPIPPGGANCTTVNQTFNTGTAGTSLVMKGAVWCAGAPRGSWTFFFELVLRDGSRAESAPAEANFVCSAP